MVIKVNFSSAVRSATNGQNFIDLKFSKDVNSLIASLSEEFGSSFADRILENGKRRQYINIYVNGTDIRYLNNLETNLNEGDEVDFIPAVSGG